MYAGKTPKRAMSSAYLITRLIPTHGDCFADTKDRKGESKETYTIKAWSQI